MHPQRIPLFTFFFAVSRASFTKVSVSHTVHDLVHGLVRHSARSRSSALHREIPQIELFFFFWEEEIKGVPLEQKNVQVDLSARFVFLFLIFQPLKSRRPKQHAWPGALQAPALSGAHPDLTEFALCAGRDHCGTCSARWFRQSVSCATERSRLRWQISSIVCFAIKSAHRYLLSRTVRFQYKNTAADKVVRVISDYALSMGSDIPDEGIMVMNLLFL